MKICIRYDLSVDLDCKDHSDYLLVGEVSEERKDEYSLIEWKTEKYIKKVIKWS